MNVLLFPTDDRSGQTSLIYHYASQGHRVYLPKPGTLGLNWSRIATWPMMLCKSALNPSKRNLDITGFSGLGPVFEFGEDWFMATFEAPLYPHDITCDIVDLETENPGIDVFHTLRGGEAYLTLYHDIAKKHFPNARWVSSTLNQMTSTPGGFIPTNVAKLVPAPYEGHHANVNNVCLVSCDFEIHLLGVAPEQKARSGFASFNHNFANRQPVDYELFTRMNTLLKACGYDEVPNYGGNIRTQGADVRYSGDSGITGNFKTISPPEAYRLTTGLTAAVHFKETDWGGGVFYYCLNAGTPIITTNRYVQASNSSAYIVDGHNALLVDNAKQASDAVIQLTEDTNLASSLQEGMRVTRKRLFGERYWNSWQSFLGRLG